MVLVNECEACGKADCNGECENYLLNMIDHEVSIDLTKFDKLFRRIPKLNYALTAKINAIFGTSLQITHGSNADEDTQHTNEFKELIYKTNDNGNTNLVEIKRALRERELFGISYLFYDDENDNLYFLRDEDVTAYKQDTSNAIIDRTLYYTVGTPDLDSMEQINWGKRGYINQLDDDGNSAGYIIHPDNMIKLQSDTYVLNSDLDELQLLLSVNLKLIDSTRLRDVGDVFVLTDTKKESPISAVDNPIRKKVNNALKSMKERITKAIKFKKTDDSSVHIMDESVRDIKQVEPITKIKDMQFVWDSQDDVISSVVNFPRDLMNMGKSNGNIAKDSIIKDARANFLTPLKSDLANSLSQIAKQKFGTEYYVRFEDYEDTAI